LNLQKGGKLLITQDERIYTIGELCDILNDKGYKDFHLSNLGYLEKVFNDMLGIQSHEYLIRLYTESDLDKLISSLKARNLKPGHNSNSSMPVVMQAAENKAYADELALDIEVVEEKSIESIETDRSIEKLKQFMSRVVSSSLQSTVVPELHDLKKDLMELKLQNQSLKASLEKQQEDHYRQIDSKLTKWREESKNKKSSWYSKIFK
jgi:hypothetical protein